MASVATPQSVCYVWGDSIKLPTKKDNINNVILISSNQSGLSCAYTGDKRIEIWGPWPKDIPPKDLVVAHKVTLLACGANYVLFSTSELRTFGVGKNTYGQLGNGTKHDCGILSEIPALNNVKVSSLSAGRAHSLCVNEKGRLYAWGSNLKNRLGYAKEGDYLEPHKLPFFDGKNVSKVSCSNDYSVALTNEGHVYGWPHSTSEAPNPTGSLFVKIKNLEKVTDIACGQTHSLAITSNSEQQLYAWGSNLRGELGSDNSSDGETAIPVKAFFAQKVKAISAGIKHSVAVLADNSIYEWGDTKTLGGNIQSKGLKAPIPTKLRFGDSLQDKSVLAVACAGVSTVIHVSYTTTLTPFEPPPPSSLKLPTSTPKPPNTSPTKAPAPPKAYTLTIPNNLHKMPPSPARKPKPSIPSPNKRPRQAEPPSIPSKKSSEKNTKSNSATKSLKKRKINKKSSDSESEYEAESTSESESSSSSEDASESSASSSSEYSESASQSEAKSESESESESESDEELEATKCKSTPPKDGASVIDLTEDDSPNLHPTASPASSASPKASPARASSPTSPTSPASEVHPARLAPPTSPTYPTLKASPAPPSTGLASSTPPANAASDVPPPRLASPISPSPSASQASPKSRATPASPLTTSIPSVYSPLDLNETPPSSPPPPHPPSSPQAPPPSLPLQPSPQPSPQPSALPPSTLRFRKRAPSPPSEHAETRQDPSNDNTSRGSNSIGLTTSQSSCSFQELIRMDCGFSYYNKFTRNGETFEKGTCVMCVCENQALIDVKIRRIEDIYENPEGEKILVLKKYYLPEETVAKRHEHVRNNEVFLSEELEEVHPDEILKRVTVRIVRNSRQNNPSNEEAGTDLKHMNSFVCCRKYDGRNQKFSSLEPIPPPPQCFVVLD